MSYAIPLSTLLPRREIIISSIIEKNTLLQMISQAHFASQMLLSYGHDLQRRVEDFQTVIELLNISLDGPDVLQRMESTNEIRLAVRGNQMFKPE